MRKFGKDLSEWMKKVLKAIERFLKGNFAKIMEKVTKLLPAITACLFMATTAISLSAILTYFITLGIPAWVVYTIAFIPGLKLYSISFAIASYFSQRQELCEAIWKFIVSISTLLILPFTFTFYTLCWLIPIMMVVLPSDLVLLLGIISGIFCFIFIQNLLTRLLAWLMDLEEKSFSKFEKAETIFADYVI